jgi:ribonuclease HI
VIIYTDGSKAENHAGASMVAVKDSTEIHINTQRLSITCTVFQSELYGISMAVVWTQSQGKKTSFYAINIDSKAALIDRSHGFIAPRPLYTGPLCPTLE